MEIFNIVIQCVSLMRFLSGLYENSVKVKNASAESH